MTRNVSCEGRIKSGNEKIYLIIDTINEAINSNRQISFQYFQYNVRKEQQLKHNGEPYVITPLHLVWNGDYYYMIGVYAYKQRVGNFRVDRIAKRPKILDAEGTPAPEDFNIDEYINTTFKMFNSEHSEVELVCDNEVMDSIIDKFGAEVTTYATFIGIRKRTVPFFALPTKQRDIRTLRFMTCKSKALHRMLLKDFKL